MIIFRVAMEIGCAISAVVKPFENRLASPQSWQVQIQHCPIWVAIPNETEGTVAGHMSLTLAN
jgi:hypothetical protein